MGFYHVLSHSAKGGDRWRGGGSGGSGPRGESEGRLMIKKVTR